VTTIDIFVGADRSQLLAVAVLEHSILRHTTRPCRVTPLIDLDLPEPADLRQGSRTNFSFARFAIPELKNYEGKAVYMDADMQVFRDVGELWSTPFDGAKVIVQDELPEEIVRQNKLGAPKRRRKQCSVMLIDCAAARWHAADIIAGLDSKYTYEELLYELCILDESEIRYGVPFEWNSLEHFDENTRLIHYTDMATQPWVSCRNPFGHVWISEVRLMLDTGALGLEEIRIEVEKGYFRPSLVTEIEEMPHARGFNEDAARRYEDIDKQAGFVKHAEVHARKKARNAALRHLEQQLKQRLA
jgi:lipopolysaccharide biosynthesis glycosyltransferase